MKNFVVHLAFVTIVTAAGILTGINNLPGSWYEGLTKPFFNPPAWVFSPVWTILYIMIGIAGARTWLRDGISMRMGLWTLQMVLNLLWSPAFFGMQSTGLGLVVILPLLATIIAFIVTNRSQDRISAWLFVPYAAWTAFATLLNLGLFLLN